MHFTENHDFGHRQIWFQAPDLTIIKRKELMLQTNRLTILVSQALFDLRKIYDKMTA